LDALQPMPAGDVENREVHRAVAPADDLLKGLG
jgi:hypothetical protein